MCLSDLLYYDMEDSIYVPRRDGYYAKMYRHWCLICRKDRGYAYKNKILRSPMCHACRMAQADVRERVASASRSRRHTPESRLKISSSLFRRSGSSLLNSKIAANLRSRLNKALRGSYKRGSAVKDLGCTIEELKLHIESKFYPHPLTGQNMSWDNYGRGGWHIDHIIPLCRFNLQDEIQLKKACHYTNLQPLWAIDNLRKREEDIKYGATDKEVS